MNREGEGMTGKEGLQVKMTGKDVLALIAAQYWLILPYVLFLTGGMALLGWLLTCMWGV